MAGYAPERSDFLPSWEISISSSFICLIPNFWGSPAGTQHLRGRNYPCRDETIPVYFCSLNYCEGRARWQQSRAVPDQSCARSVPDMHCAQHHPRDFCPTFLLAPLSALTAFMAAGIQDTGQLCDYLSTEALNSLGDGADRGGGEGGVALSAQGGTGWKKMIYTYVYFLSETQQDRNRWVQE